MCVPSDSRAGDFTLFTECSGVVGARGGAVTRSVLGMSIAIDLTRALAVAPSDDAGRHRVPDAVGVGVFAGGVEAGDVPPGLDAPFLRAQGFEGKPGQSCVVPGVDGQVVVALGLGAAADATVTTYRRAAAALARAAQRQTHLAIDVLDTVPEALDRTAVAQAIAEGVLLGAYRYTALKSDPERSHIESLTVVGKGGKRILAALDRGRAVGEAVRVARDLVNQPGGTLTPTAFAARAEELADLKGFDIEVLDRAAIAELELGGLLGVNRGSAEEPRFVKLSWEPGVKPRGTVALVGKGITFDSGGLSLKPSDSMIGMKGDMAGAAAVLATFSALDAVQPPVRVVGYMPLTDNMPGGDAMRVGDVLRIRNGTTVEVLNTDAEGRLVLADALTLATEDEPDAIVDLATLTGACMVALGTKIAGLMGNHQGFADQVLAAADAQGEPMWQLPLPAEMRKSIESEVADLKNISSTRWGGASVAGVFLQEFVGDGIPWAHLDIAGPADAAEDDGVTRKGGTGYGVRTLLHLLSTYRKPSRRPSE
ncbi:MAG: leucyl aminopeptidase [Acidimicrobiales bacterium]|nr:leucyl aminopeptidase [Acidimicrobiales bacterium]